MSLSEENRPKKFNTTMRTYRLMVDRIVKYRADWNIEFRSSLLLFSEQSFRVEELKPIPATIEKMDT